MWLCKVRARKTKDDMEGKVGRHMHYLDLEFEMLENQMNGEEEFMWMITGLVYWFMWPILIFVD